MQIRRDSIVSSISKRSLNNDGFLCPYTQQSVVQSPFILEKDNIKRCINVYRIKCLTKYRLLCYLLHLQYLEKYNKCIGINNKETIIWIEKIRKMLWNHIINIV